MKKLIILFLALSLFTTEILEEEAPVVTAVQCMTVNIFFEARGESIEGMKAVAATVINRTKHKSYPSTVCSAVFQPKQFSWTHQQKPADIVKLLNADLSDLSQKDKQAYHQAETIAQKPFKELLEALPKGVTHYHATYVKPAWAKAMKKVKKIGQHIFYKNSKDS